MPATVTRFLRILVVGPDLLASALHALLSSVDDFSLSSPLSTAAEVLPFVERLTNSTGQIDVVVLYRSGSLSSDARLLASLAAIGVRTLVVSTLLYTGELELLQRVGVQGYLFAFLPASHLTRAIRRIATGEMYFPAPPSALMEQGASVENLSRPQRRLVFHPEVLQELCDYIHWQLASSDLAILRNFGDITVKETAYKVGRPDAAIRRDLSERIYEFLGLVSGREVNSRYAAFQLLLEYGVLEYVLELPTS